MPRVNRRRWITGVPLQMAIKVMAFQPGDKVRCQHCKGPHVFAGYDGSTTTLRLTDPAFQFLSPEFVIGWKPLLREDER